MNEGSLRADAKQNALSTAVSVILAVFIVLAILPATANALTISGDNVGIGKDNPAQPLDVVGNINASGTVTADSFSGNGTGIANIDPTKITSGTANINISGNAATATTATTATTASSVAAGGVSNAGLANGSVTPEKIGFYGNVAIVAPSGGDYNNPATAMSVTEYANWCGTPSATNPCLLKIMPGIYTVTSPVVMQPYIDIEGSGEKVTRITAAFSFSAYPPTVATVLGANNAELRFLTIANTGTGAYTVAILNTTASPSMIHATAAASRGNWSYGIYNNSSSPTMTDVTATGSGGTYTYGVANVYSSSPTMSNVTATGSGGAYNYGVGNSTDSSPTMSNVTAIASGGTDNYGILNASSSPAMTNVTATGSGGTDINIGVWNSYSSPTMSNVTATGSGGTYNYGILNESAGTVKINHSVTKGSTNSISNDSGVTMLVGNTQLDGGAVSNAGILTCVGAYNGSYQPLNASCTYP